jgi:DNA-binding response OmpR family regulator
MTKILLVDDDSDLLLLLGHVLEVRGYQPIQVADARDVMRTVSTVQPDIIILDINMGQYDGTSICRELKSNPAYNHIPVVLFSAIVSEADAVINCKADGFIEKPVSTGSFLHEIESLIAA